ncbi:MAG: MFS transporter [Actinobacteria bacterium]|nr:MFS transporter [Actinomycetota bacterium]
MLTARLVDRLLDDSYSTETRRHVLALTTARLTANACFRFAPPFLASISDDFDISLSRLGLALMITELAMGASPLLGSFVDRMRRRSAMTGGLLGISAAAVVTASSPNVWIFIVGILMISVAKFFFDIGLSAWVNDHVLYEQRGRVIGITETSWALGLLVGVTVMGLVASQTSWRWGYAVGAGAVGLMALVIGARLERHDVAGSTRQHDAVRTPMPRPGYLVVAAMFFLMASSQAMFVTFGPWLDDEFGFSEAGIAAVAFGLGAFELLASVTSARRTDAWGKERSAMAGAMLIAPAGVLLAVLHTQQVPGLLMLGLFLLGFEFAIVSLLPLAANLIPDAPGRGLGIVLAGGMLGRASMSVVATATYDRFGIEVPALVGACLALCMIVCLMIFSRDSRS